jgi:hypothetical protein
MGKKFLGALNSHLSVNIFLVREPIATHLQLKNISCNLLLASEKFNIIIIRLRISKTNFYSSPQFYILAYISHHYARQAQISIVHC